MVEETVGVLDQEKPPQDLEDAHTIESADVRAALRRNRQYGDLPVRLIEPDPEQVRRVDTTGEAFEGLVESVRQHGVLESISVRWFEDRKVFQVVTGERRFRAAQKAGLEFIPAIVRDVTDTKKAIHQLVENLQREDMNPVDEAKAFRRYLAATGGTQAQLAREVGKSEPYVSRMMTLLEKLDINEQEELARIAPAQLPGKSLILEAIRTTDPETRRAILFGQMTRKEARAAVRPKKTGGRPRYASKTYTVDDPPASVTVRLKSPTLTPDDVQKALMAAYKKSQEGV